MPQRTFEPYTSTKTSILFAQKKTKKEIQIWDDAWAEASIEYSFLRTRTQNLMDVHDGKKQRSRLPSIKGLSTDDEVAILKSILKNRLTEQDNGCNANDLITKYRRDLEDICSHDRDTQDAFGFVNTWWVFSEVAAKLNYSVFMSEAENIGYKRSKRGEKLMPNELFSD